MSSIRAEEDFEPQEDFSLPSWVDLDLGFVDLSINKAVVYLLVGAAVTIFLGIWLMRFGLSLRPSKRQTAGESVYELVYTQMAEASLPHKRAIKTWFPYVAALFLFIWVVNMIGFIPLPISDHHFTIAGVELPTWGIYAATANLSVTLSLALLTFIATHVEGVRYNGPVRYVKSWIPAGVPGFLVPFIFVLEIISQFMRLISLSVRLFANMLAGHMLILVFIGLIFIFESVAIAIISVPVGTIIYLFEVVVVVTIQAFVFALLTAIYLGGAIEPDH
jgi:F-type H+-transporting ATPase subunit a